jgi:glycerophosphoryl diester phosphodiesterase
MPPAQARAFDLQGHRGARWLFPENTLEGFAATAALGVPTLELDVGITADDVVVVCHDPALNPDVVRDAAGNWLPQRGPRLRELTLAELRRYDVGRLRPGSGYAATFPEQAPRDGARIPTLAQVLQACPSTRFNIELKTFPLQPEITIDGGQLAEAVAAVADACHAADRIIVQSFDWRGPRRLKRTRPDIAVAWLTRKETIAAARAWWACDAAASVPQAVAAEGGPTWGPVFTDLTEAHLAEAHRLGLRVVPWTVNHPQDMRRLIDWGIDGLITDRPDLALQILRSKGLMAS